MADSSATTVKLENGEIGHLAPNIKSAALQEVEDDAVYLTEKRFAEQREDYQREQDKAARERQREDSKVTARGQDRTVPKADEKKGN